jgi:thymidylate kinase
MLREIALLGQDGIGKSTIAAALASSLEADGLRVSVTSWTKSLRDRPSDFSKKCLSDLLFAAYRGMYAAAGCRDTSAAALFPATAEEFLSGDCADQLLELDVDRNSTWGVVAGAFAELSGNLFFRSAEVDKKIEQGYVVIQETFGYKHLVKDLYLAKNLAIRNGDHAFLPVIESLEALNETIFSTVLAPQFGFVIDGDPELAVQRRLDQSGGAGWTEDLQIACDRTRESFVRMQNYTREKFREYAKRHGWQTVEIANVSLEYDVARVVEYIRQTIGSAFGGGAGRGGAGWLGGTGRYETGRS